jgi:hypothetical protein
MKNSTMKITICFASLFILTLFYFTHECITENMSIVLEDFEKYSDKDDIFNAWLLREDNKKEASDVYKVIVENNNKFLSARSTGSSIQIAKKVKWDIKAFPVLSWKWRAAVLPKDANEDATGKNDSGASIYVIFQRSRIPFLSWEYQPINVIKYVWSTTLPVGKVVYKEKSKLGSTIYEGYFFVIESGIDNAGKWITEERDVLDDYKKVFGDNPKYDPYLIAILSDSNDTKSTASADYDEIKIKKP